MTSFKKGDRVKLSQQARNNGLKRRFRYGTVIGPCRDRSLVKVIWDGYKTPDNYAIEFIVRAVCDADKLLTKSNPDNAEVG